MALVIYDMDDTLLNEDCSRLWIQYLVEMGLSSADPVLSELAQLDLDYRQGKLDMDRYLELQLRPHIGTREEDLAPLVDRFLHSHILHHIGEKARDNVKAHQANGDTTLVISASVEFLVHPIARAIGIEHSIGIRLEKEGGKITGRANGVMSFREGKITRLREWVEENGMTMENSWFYSDSRNDLPLLEKVSNPVVINGDPHLLSVAKQRGWPSYDWRNAA